MVYSFIVSHSHRKTFDSKLKLLGSKTLGTNVLEL